MATLFLRNISEETRQQAWQAAGARGMTLAQYVTALIDLHGDLREALDDAHGPAEQLQLVRDSVVRRGLWIVER